MTEFLDNTHLSTLGALNASMACFAAISILGRVCRIDTRARWAWLGAGALILATGIWSMHFVALLTLDIAINLTHAPRLAIQSWLCMFATALIALHRGPC